MTHLLHIIAALVLSLGGGQAPQQAVHVEPPKPGHAEYGRIEVPRLHLDAPIRADSRLRELKDAVGHLPSTYWPGMGGTVALFGHRKTPWGGMTHGPFRYINRLRAGDRIVVTMPYGRYTYVVRGHRIIRPTALREVRASLDREELLVAACTDKHGGTSYWNNPRPHVVYRYVVRAVLVP